MNTRRPGDRIFSVAFFNQGGHSMNREKEMFQSASQLFKILLNEGYETKKVQEWIKFFEDRYAEQSMSKSFVRQLTATMYIRLAEMADLKFPFDRVVGKTEFPKCDCRQRIIEGTDDWFKRLYELYASRDQAGNDDFYPPAMLEMDALASSAHMMFKEHMSEGVYDNIFMSMIIDVADEFDQIYKRKKAQATAA